MDQKGASPEMLQTLRQLRKKVVIGFVGGSNLAKITEQLETEGNNGVSISAYLKVWLSLKWTSAIQDFDYAFAENGLTAYKLGKEFPSQSFIKFLGEEKYKVLAKFILHYIADLDIPIKRYAMLYSLTEQSIELGL